MAKNNPGAAKSAAGPSGMVLLEQAYPRPERLLVDDVAPRMSTGTNRFFYRASKASLVRSGLFRMYEKFTPGIWAMFVGRKCYIQDEARASVDDGRATQMVSLGAGMDTLFVRDRAFVDLPCFEVDLPGSMEAKRAALVHALGEVPEHVNLVSVDFAEDSLGPALEQAGYDPERVTCFVAEAVTQYLDDDAVRSTFEFLAQAAPGSRVIFTYIRQEFLDGSDDFGLGLLRKRLGGNGPRWLFAMTPDEVADLVGPYGYRVLSNVGSAEIDARYAEGRERSFRFTDLEPIAVIEKEGGS